MNYFTSALDRLGISRQKPEPEPPRSIALESSELGKLPRELIRHICSFLPPESAAIFTLCCRPIYSILGAQIIAQPGSLVEYAAIVEEENDCYKFLTLLARDLPNHIACYRCNQLHEFDKGYFKKIHPCLRMPEILKRYIEATWPRFEVNANFFHMLMKRHRQGRDCSKLLGGFSQSVKYRRKSISGPPFRAGFNCQGRTSAIIAADGSLLLRKNSHLRTIYCTGKAELFDPIHQICHHIYSEVDPGGKLTISQDVISPDRGTQPIRRRLHIVPLHLIHYCSPIIKFGRCPTELIYCWKPYFYGGGIELSITQWHDLGEGRSHLDEKLRSLLERARPPVDFEKGSIFDRFESETSSKIKALMNKEAELSIL